jgi:hypothetical protein
MRINIQKKPKLPNHDGRRSSAWQKVVRFPSLRPKTKQQIMTDAGVRLGKVIRFGFLCFLHPKTKQTLEEILDVQVEHVGRVLASAGRVVR